MAKNKSKRSLDSVGEAQKQTEKTNKDKFASTQSLIQETQKKKMSSKGRISPQLSCTILPEDKKLLSELTIFAVNKAGKAVNTSQVIRALIRLGVRKMDELEF